MMPGDSYDHLESPPVLSADTYERVQNRVLGGPRRPDGQWEQTAGSCVMYQNGQLPQPLTPAHSTSLRQQLHQVVTWPGTLHHSLDNRPPEAFVFIRPAGIALRHTLDGFYDKLYGGIVRRHGPKRPPVALLPIDTFKYQQWNIDAEAEQLRSKIGNTLGHVCLIDNYARFFDDSELQLAAAVVHAAGVPDVTALRTMLYERLDPRDINVNKLQVPRHAKFMSRLGKLCCNLDYNQADE